MWSVGPRPGANEFALRPMSENEMGTDAVSLEEIVWGRPLLAKRQRR